MTAPELSVLIVSWNTIDQLRVCLRSLHREADHESYEVIAVDNGSVDGSADLLRGDPLVTLIANDHNAGFAAAVNQAYRRATGEYVMLLNTDIEFRPGALTTMLGFLRGRPDVAQVSPRYLNPDGTFQQHYVQLPTVAACLGLWTGLKRLPPFRRALDRFRMVGEDFSQPRQLASASCTIVRTSAIPTADIFDERFPIYWNDAVFVRAQLALGHTMWMLPEAEVIHDRGASCVRLGPAIRFRHLLGGMVNYLDLTRPALTMFAFRTAIAADYLAKTALGRTTTLGWGDLRAALRGDVGELPDGDTRPWRLVAGDVPGGVKPDGSSRLAVIDAGATKSARRFRVAGEGTDQVWISLGRAVPFGIGIGTWVNQRLAAARLRRWLDRQTGARSLETDADHAYLARWLGEDVGTGGTRGAPQSPQTAAIG